MTNSCAHCGLTSDIPKCQIKCARSQREIELLCDQRDTNLAKEVELVQRLTRERDYYKVWWERDSTSLGKALNEVSSLCAGKEQFRVQIEQLRGNLSLAEEGLANYALEIERLQKREKDLMDVIDSRERALGFVPLDDVHTS